MNRFEKWELAAKALPMIALFITTILYFLWPETLLELFLCIVLICISVTAVVWWWWIMKVSANLVSQVTRNNEMFSEIVKEVKEIKKDLPTGK